MGEYYKWVNVDKKEYLDPIDFDIGCKAWQSIDKGNPVLMAVHQLLNSDWKNDKIFFMGDEKSLTKNEKNPILEQLYVQTIEYGYPGSINDLVCDTYKNVSPLFKDAEEEVRQEIESCIMHPEDCMSEHIKESYGFDSNHPYRGMFLREGQYFKYIINYTKKLYYTFDRTQIRYQNKELDIHFDPLPQLLGFGNYMGHGRWLGDIIGVSNDVPDGLTLIDEILLDW